MLYLCQRVSRNVRVLWRRERFMANSQTWDRNSTEEKKAITSVFPWVRCHRQSSSWNYTQTPTHPAANPSSLQFVAAHLLSSWLVIPMCSVWDPNHTMWVSSRCCAFSMYICVFATHVGYKYVCVELLWTLQTPQRPQMGGLNSQNCSFGHADC